MNKIIVFLFVIMFVIFFGCKDSNSAKRVSLESQKSNEDYIEQGKDIASSAFLALSGELRSAIQEGGLENALTYCNLNALALTDSLSQAYNVDIKRTSLKYRNPKNRPSPDEVEILNEYQKALESEGQLFPKVIDVAGVNKFYAPIIMQDACLKCHGAKASIPVYKSILKHYPDDLATDYAMGDLRGIWSVTFRK